MEISTEVKYAAGGAAVALAAAAAVSYLGAPSRYFMKTPALDAPLFLALSFLQLSKCDNVINIHCKELPRSKRGFFSPYSSASPPHPVSSFHFQSRPFLLPPPISFRVLFLIVYELLMVYV